VKYYYTIIGPTKNTYFTKSNSYLATSSPLPTHSHYLSPTFEHSSDMLTIPDEDIVTKEIESWRGFAHSLKSEVNAKEMPFPTEPLIMALLLTHKMISWLSKQVKSKRIKSKGEPHYSVGKKYCRRCGCYFITKKIFCECCGMQLRTTPMESYLKQKMRENLITPTKKKAAGRLSTA